MAFPNIDTTLMQVHTSFVAVMLPVARCTLVASPNPRDDQLTPLATFIVPNKLGRRHLDPGNYMFSARLAQSVERETLSLRVHNLKVAGSTPALGFSYTKYYD